MIGVVRFGALVVSLALSLARGLAELKPMVGQRGVRPAAAGPKSSPLAAAGAFYQRTCAKCHGEDRTGSGARDSSPEIPDFTKKSWQAKRTDVQLLVSILDGKGTHMPSFRERLDTDLARQLVAYVREAAPAQAAPQALSDDFARRFADLTTELEDLRAEFRRLMGLEGKPGAKTDKAPMESPR